MDLSVHIIHLNVKMTYRNFMLIFLDVWVSEGKILEMFKLITSFWYAKYFSLR